MVISTGNFTYRDRGVIWVDRECGFSYFSGDFSWLIGRARVYLYWAAIARPVFHYFGKQRKKLEM
jgi:hypothetical protein